jgi:hypothetical protein
LIIHHAEKPLVDELLVGTAARRGHDAYQAIRAVQYGQSVLLPGLVDTGNKIKQDPSEDLL